MSHRIICIQRHYRIQYLSTNIVVHIQLCTFNWNLSEMSVFYNNIYNTGAEQKWAVQDVILLKIFDLTMVSIVDWLRKNPRHASGTFS